MEKIIINSPKYGQKEVFIDLENYEYIKNFNWILEKGSNTFYAYRKQKNKTIKMHREIMNLNFGDGLIVDHINHNGLDNRKINLRIATKKENAQNSLSQKNSSSKYLGVSFYKRDKIWTAQIKINDKKKHLGRFEKEIDAAIAYNNAAIINYKNFANLNII